MRRKYLYFIIAWAFVFALYSFLNYIHEEKDTKTKKKSFYKENKDNINENFININFPWQNDKTETIFIKDNLQEKGVYYKAVNQLLKLKKKKSKTFPKDLNLNELYIVKGSKGIIVDFNESMIKDFPSGTYSEFEFLNLISNNVFLLSTVLNADYDDFDEINWIYFLSAGNVYHSISGHLDIERPFYRKSNIVNPFVNIRKLISSNETKTGLIQRICIDPGHGGEDKGIEVGEDFIEKDITLRIATGLRRRIVDTFGIDTILTRNRDKNISLDSRNSMANNQKADLFISIHVNFSFQSYRHGAMTFINSVSTHKQNISNLDKIKDNLSQEENDEKQLKQEKKLLLEWNEAQNIYIAESYKVAQFIQAELNQLCGKTGRKVSQLPIRVLSSLSMPAVLVEVGFASNWTEKEKLKQGEYLNKLTNAVFRGISYYINSRTGQ